MTGKSEKFPFLNMHFHAANSLQKFCSIYRAILVYTRNQPEPEFSKVLKSKYFLKSKLRLKYFIEL